MGTIPVLKSRFTLLLDSPPCCVQFCPLHPDYFIVGTYNLLQGTEGSPKDQKREGSIVLCKLNNDRIQTTLCSLFPDLCKHNSTIVKEVPLEAGVLDVQIRINTIAAATSIGTVVLLNIVRSRSAAHQDLDLEFTCKIQIKPASHVITSVAWSPFTELTESPELCTTDASGEVVAVAFPRDLLDGPLPGLADLTSTLVNDSDNAVPARVLHSHTLEAWTCAWVPWWTAPRNGLLSGGDDCYLHFKGLLEGSALKETPEHDVLTWSDRRLHQAGVTAILPLANGVVATGSYDDHLRIILMPGRPGQKPRLLQQICLGGGVWRLKIINANRSMGSFSKGSPFSGTLLISCMFAGAYIVQVGSTGGDHEEWSVRVVARFTEHESMNYACDVQPAQAKWQSEVSEESAIPSQPVDPKASANAQTTRNIVSCSFYDRRLSFWQFNGSQNIAE